MKKPDKTSGLCRLYIVYNYKGKQWIQTGVKVRGEYWDQKGQYIMPGQPLQKRLNNKLTLKKADVQNALDRLQRDKTEPTAEAVRYLLKPNKFVPPPIVNEVYLSDLLRAYASDFKKTKKRSYLRKFETIGRHIDTYRSKFKANEFTSDELELYLNYLLEEFEIENNTLHDHVRKIRLVLERSHKKGEIDNTDYIDFQYKYVKPKPFWLNWKRDLPKLENYQPTEQHDIIIKEEWLLRAYTGLRWSDVHNMEPYHFIKASNGDVYYDYTVIKTSLDQNILLDKKAVAILEKWKYRLPKFKNDYCNERIKIIAKNAGLDITLEKVRFSGNERKVSILPQWKMLTTHVARRTFARHWVDVGGDLSKLSKYLGHSTVQQTSDYVGYDTKEVNDELKKVMG